LWLFLFGVFAQLIAANFFLTDSRFEPIPEFEEAAPYVSKHAKPAPTQQDSVANATAKEPATVAFNASEFLEQHSFAIPAVAEGAKPAIMNTPKPKEPDLADIIESFLNEESTQAKVACALQPKQPAASFVTDKAPAHMAVSFSSARADASAEKKQAEKLPPLSFRKTEEEAFVDRLIAEEEFRNPVVRAYNQRKYDYEHGIVREKDNSKMSKTIAFPRTA
jgi:hypothetical protein